MRGSLPRRRRQGFLQRLVRLDVYSASSRPAFNSCGQNRRRLVCALVGRFLIDFVIKSPDTGDQLSRTDAIFGQDFGDTLMEILIGMPSSDHFAMRLIASISTHSPISLMMFSFSAAGIKVSGIIRPEVGWFQRIGASADEICNAIYREIE
ncbi:hypothetical protein [Parasphingorhabdus sp. NYA22]